MYIPLNLKLYSKEVHIFAKRVLQPFKILVNKVLWPIGFMFLTLELSQLV